MGLKSSEKHRGKNGVHMRVAVEQRAAQVAQLYLQGKTQHEIAQIVGVQQPRVCKDLKLIREEWRAARVADFDEAKDRELARIDHIEREAWAAWGRSVGQRKTTTREMDGSAPPGSAPSPAKVTVKTEEQPGDPRFLERVQWCVDQRCKVLGLYAPKRIEVGVHEAKARLAAMLGVDPKDLDDQAPATGPVH